MTPNSPRAGNAMHGANLPEFLHSLDPNRTQLIGLKHGMGKMLFGPSAIFSLG